MLSCIFILKVVSQASKLSVKVCQLLHDGLCICICWYGGTTERAVRRASPFHKSSYNGRAGCPAKLACLSGD